MAESHYCEKHGCDFKKYEKEGKTWYAHPYKDRDGETRWCNEPKAETIEKPVAERAFDKGDLKSAGELELARERIKQLMARETSIEKQVSLKCALEVDYGSTKSVADILGIAEQFHQWLSKGVVPEPTLVQEAKKIGAKEALATKEQVDKLLGFVKDKLINLAPIVKKCGYPVQEMSKYTESEAAHIILNAEIALAEKK